MTETAASEPARVDPRYYADGATWEHDIARRNRNSRALAWIVASVMSVVAIVALGVLALLVPLKTYEPYMVVVDKATGFVEVKRPMAEGALTQDEAVTMFNVVRYIKARETYDPKALKDNFDLAQLLASGDAARELTEIYSPANPNNPVKVFGTNTTVAVNIKSVTFPNNRTALVRFSAEEKSATNTITRHWVSLVRFRYTGTPMRNEWRFENPLGFQVLEYRRDQETAPSPGTAEAQP
ncbi:virB8 family protein [Bradyrhizobium viridifuturi]|uniref:virB8 family protein n=1 Tax=uncultured Bradyrhizobium sp. TaxID=199684 RepID=UPI001BAB5EA9|nr:virB8 family protein [uncultured Bradyrhizobium sp.]MBR1040687.1 virB8 family protein [Bradyrhizobium viridifuturi]MBR1074975.1 virB8 family protein [Bradyrhizobium viridifuturi]